MFNCCNGLRRKLDKHGGYTSSIEQRFVWHSFHILFTGREQCFQVTKTLMDVAASVQYRVVVDYPSSPSCDHSGAIPWR